MLVESPGRRRRMKASRSRARVLVAFQFLTLLLLVLNPFGRWFEVERVISLTLFIFAAIILANAAVALGSALTASPIPKDDAQLVTHGIYRYIRHPMYSALLLIGLGLVISRCNLFAVLIFASLAAVLTYKSRYEDALLVARHQDAKEYQSRTGRFLPRW
jgi:protein-S-isoprenylcysteine O-methyltransferase Ste14